jgi:hypothetical protein
MTSFRQIVPNSTLNPSNERFEHYLVWLSPSGGVRNWLFSHTDGEEDEKYDNTVIESLEDIRSVPTEQRKTVNCITKTLDPFNFEYVKSVMASNRVYKVLKNGSKIPIAVKSGSVIQGNTLKEFQLRIKFEYKESDILNV